MKSSITNGQRFPSLKRFACEVNQISVPLEKNPMTLQRQTPPLDEYATKTKRNVVVLIPVVKDSKS